MSSKMMAEVGGFQGLPMDSQLTVAKLVMERQQLETVHNMVMPREFCIAIDKGWYKAIERRLFAKEWSVRIKDTNGNFPVQRCLAAIKTDVASRKVALRKVFRVLLRHGGKPAKTFHYEEQCQTTALSLALDTETMRLLVQNGLKTRVLYNYAIESYGYARDKPFDRAYVKFLMQNTNPDIDECKCVLYAATSDNNVSLHNITLLLEEGCDRGLQVGEYSRKWLLDKAKEEQNEAVHALLCAELAKLNEEPPAKRARTE
jgi:hypothetical protein